MKVLFIYPSLGERKYYKVKKSGDFIKTTCLEPLAIATLNGLTPENWQTEFNDDRIENINYENDADLIAITTETYSAKRAYEISEIFKKKGKKVVLGGWHPSLCPEEAKEHADSILIGEAEGVWLELLRDAEKDDLKPIYRGKTSSKLSINVDKSIFKNKKYFPVSLIETGRGCKFSCEFCCIIEFFGRNYRRRIIKEVILEIKKSKNKDILFVDDNIVGDIESAKELFKALIPYKIRWYSQASIDLVKDEEMLLLMKKSGCSGLLLGLESINEKNLLQMKKFHNIWVQKKFNPIKKLHDLGIKVYGAFVIGYDYDNEKNILETAKFAIKNNFFLANFYQLTPMPGTKLYDRLKREGKLLYDKWWLDKDYSYGELVYKHPSLSSEKVAELCNLARKKFYSRGSILKRLFNFKANSKNIRSLLIYLGINYSVRKEIHEKQGMKLGKN
tara:strand:+ start:5004 stop:6341 length:1338 start_codon:yes stop_codon:yes gene_type:complete